jgi:beta-N-acetylhexosaminidase
MTRRPLVLLLCAAVALLPGCGGGDPAAPSTPSSATSSDAPTSPGPSPTPAALAWGPTEDELAAARETVAGWTPEQLAGGVLVPRYDGTDPQAPAELVRELHVAGVIVMGDNVVDAEQVRASAEAVQQAAREDGRDWPAVVSVDQEGGLVARLKSPVAADFPTFMSAGAAIAGGRARGDEAGGAAVVQEAASATGLELRDLGFTWVFAPDADVTSGPDDPTIGSRAASDDPSLASAAVTAALAGYEGAGIVPVVKHFPGHGSVPADSHETLPVQDATIDELRARDLQPFSAATAAGAPAVMMSHIAVDAFEPGVPASLSAPAYASLRGPDVGFEGLAVTDAQDMGAITAQYGSGGAAVTALQAGADVLLMPLDLTSAHTAVVTALGDGSLPRQRVEDAAAKVVAVQTWQGRVAGEAAVPPDAGEAAAEAARALSAAAVTAVDGSCAAPWVSDALQVAGGTDADRARLAAAAERAGVATGSGPTVRLLGGSSGGSGDVVVALDAPWALGSNEGGTATVALYGRGDGAFDALVAVLTGVSRPQGALPVSIGRTSSTDC